MGKTEMSLRQRISKKRRQGARAQGIQRSNQQGQSVLEMTIALPILLMLLIAVVDFARAFDAYIVLTNAVREGARTATRDLGLDEPFIQELVRTDVVGSGTNITNMADFGVDDVTVETGSRAVTVTVSYEFEMWFAGIVGMDTVQLVKQSAMPIMSAD
jgi:Flp pilus assembly protein TadG